MNLKRIAAAAVMTVSVLGAAFGVAAPAAHADTTPSPTPTPPSTCLPNNADDTWPAWVDGQPLRSGGVSLWHDEAGWHVRVTHNSLHDRVFSGEIATKGTLVNVTGVKLERNDSLKVGPNGHAIVFRFNNYGHVDGFDFDTSCGPALAMGFLTDGHRVAKSRISIGAGQAHPATNPFVIKRTA